MRFKLTNAVWAVPPTYPPERLESEGASLLPRLQQAHEVILNQYSIPLHIRKGETRHAYQWKETEGLSPFDGALDRETWSLYNHRLQWDLESVTKRRRRLQGVTNLLDNLIRVQEATMGELEELAKEEEDHLDPSLPDC
ncbi:hypothetical protein BJY52DRAFT_1187754 [Lactarius psammicola]|nr:hypothetical protein BJY52DRAFT_1187754 [Lactarius psammicola]